MKNIVTANEELNGWCGTENINYYEGDTALGFLFKYAVSKLDNPFITMHYTEGRWLVSVYHAKEEGKPYRVRTTENKDPALALFRAIYDLTKITSRNTIDIRWKG